MEHFPEIFDTEDGEVSIVNAFAFSKDTMFLSLDAHNPEEDLSACALIRVNLTGSNPTYKVMDEFSRGALAHFSWSPDRHMLMTSGGYLQEFVGGEMQHYPFPAEGYRSGMGPIGENDVLVFGEDGSCFRFSEGSYTELPTGTREDLHSSEFVTPEKGHLAGDYGTLLRWNGTSFTRIELGMSLPIRDIHTKADGTILLACEDGTGVHVIGDECRFVEGNDADLYAVTEFQGVELWGDDVFGLLGRNGDEFIPMFETTYAFNLNTHNDLLTVNAGYDTYIYDGKDWVRIVVNPDMSNLIERAPIEFQT